MLQLPSNVTVAALALALGVLIGAGGYHVLTEDAAPNTDLEQMGEMEGQAVLERIRSIAPSDTAGQDEADVEIRYKRDTTIVHDTIEVPAPPSLSDPYLVDNRPIEVTSEQVTLTRWNPRKARFEQQLYAVPQESFSASAYATMQAWAPARDLSLDTQKVWAGLGLSLRWRRLEASVSALTTPTLSDQRVRVGLRFDLSR